MPSGGSGVEMAATVLGVLLWGALLLMALLSARLFFGQAREAIAGRGRVDARLFGSAEFGIGCAISFWFGWMVVAASSLPPQTLEPDDLLTGTLLFAAVVGFLFTVLSIRGRDPAAMFGLRVLKPGVAAVKALRLLVAALPLVMIAGAIAGSVRGGPEEMQEVVRFFQESRRSSNIPALIMIAVAGGLVAPILEETIFRGFLYGALKRFAGPAFAMIFTAGLFAAIHLNAAAFPVLFILALCLALAYETTGSLLVPIAMHALFNLGNLSVLYVLTPP